MENTEEIKSAVSGSTSMYAGMVLTASSVNSPAVVSATSTEAGGISSSLKFQSSWSATPSVANSGAGAGAGAGAEPGLGPESL